MRIRATSLLLSAIFALCSGNPSRADMILTSDARSAGGIGCAPGVDAAAAAPGAVLDAETEAYFRANPDHVQQTGCPECFVVVGVAVIVTVGFLFGSTDTPTPGY